MTDVAILGRVLRNQIVPHPTSIGGGGGGGGSGTSGLAPAVRTYKIAVSPITVTDGTAYVYTWDGVMYDQGTSTPQWSATPDNTVLTVQEDGVYQVTAQLFYRAGGTGGEVQGVIELLGGSGSPIAGNYDQIAQKINPTPPSGFYGTLMFFNLSAQLSLNVGDTLRLILVNHSGDDVAVYGEYDPTGGDGYRQPNLAMARLDQVAGDSGADAIATTTAAGDLKIDLDPLTGDPVGITKYGLLQPAPSSLTSALVQIGDQPFDGTTSGFFSSDQPLIGVNVSDTTHDFIDLQKEGKSIFSVGVGYPTGVDAWAISGVLLNARLFASSLSVNGPEAQAIQSFGNSMFSTRAGTSPFNDDCSYNTRIVNGTGLGFSSDSPSLVLQGTTNTFDILSGGNYTSTPIVYESGTLGEIWITDSSSYFPKISMGKLPGISPPIIGNIGTSIDALTWDGGTTDSFGHQVLTNHPGLQVWYDHYYTHKVHISIPCLELSVGDMFYATTNPHGSSYTPVLVKITAGSIGQTLTLIDGGGGVPIPAWS